VTRRLAALVVLVLLALPSAAQSMTVYGASSLREALPGLDKSPKYSFGASNTLRLQIERGAGADLFVSADTEQPRALYTAGRCERPVTVATNVVALLVPKDNPARITSVYSLRRGGLRLALATPGVPIGDYTRSLLRRLRMTSVLSTNTVSMEPNVGSVATKVAFASADAGFTYITDAGIVGDRVRAIALPRWAQPPVSYQACVVRRAGADEAAASAYLRRLTSGQGRTVLKHFGFGLPRRS
jgi:molybdate transport system substrate-binding protein